MGKNVSFFTSAHRYRFVFILLLGIFLQTNFPICNADAMATTEQETMTLFAEKSKIFAFEMMNTLRSLKANENIVFSPLSVQTCAAMARVGATGETATQLNDGLGLISTDLNRMADSFSHILAKYLDSNILKIANKIYIMEGYKIKSTFNEILSKKFYTTAEELNFAENFAAANAINAWVESKTNNLIKKLVSPDAVNGDTRLVLLNAIHFKGEWVHKFRKSSTHEHDFYLNDVDTAKVQMMSQKERFAYADLPELDATALELPYRDTDLTMLIILPNSRTGLSNLLEKLQNVPLTEITSKLNKMQVLVKIPKFKAEFQIELNDAFKKLGMTRMFSKAAEFNEMLDSPEELMVSKVIHKAFIDVNEEGTEAAAATGMLIRKKRSAANYIEPKEFIAEHPFLYFINHAESIHDVGTASSDTTSGASQAHPVVSPLFMGTVATLADVASSVSESTMHDEL